MVPIRENLLSKSKYDLKVPVESCAKDMKYIVVHNTANDASAANEVAYMIRNDSSMSFNAAVDDKEIVIGIPLSRGAFAAGQRDGNAHGIHIEICYSLSGGTRFDKAEKNAAECRVYRKAAHRAQVGYFAREEASGLRRQILPAQNARQGLGAVFKND